MSDNAELVMALLCLNAVMFVLFIWAMGRGDQKKDSKGSKPNDKG